MPDWKAEIRSRLRGLNVHPTRESELVEELSQHFELFYQELLGDGASPDEACRLLMEELNESDLLVQELRRIERIVRPEPQVTLGTRRNRMLANLLNDLRYGLRQLRKTPGLTAAALITLALGIGSTTAIFSVVYATLYEPMPYPDPDQLTIVWSKATGGRNQVSPGDFFDWKRRSASFKYLEAATSETFNVATADRPEQVLAQIATPGFLTMFGYTMTLGRDFVPEEGEAGNSRSVILTHKLWRERFGANPELIGQQIRMNGDPYTVVGVMPPGQADRLPFQVWLPLTFNPDQINHKNHSLMVIGRLKSNVSLDKAQTEMESIAAQLEQEYPDSNTNLGISVEALHNDFLPEATIKNLWLLLGAVGLLFLIACANVANLLLARGSARIKEVALRASLGASRARVFSQFLTEGLVLALVGGVLGVLMAALLVKIIVLIMPEYMLPSEADVRLSVPVLLFTFATSIAGGLLFGAAPAWKAADLNLSEVLKEGGRTSGGSARNRLRKILVVTEFALAVTLLASGGFALRSFWNLTRVDLGIETDHLLTFALPVPGKRFTDSEQVNAYYRRLLERIGAVPGVNRVSAMTGMPLRGPSFGMGFKIVGAADDTDSRRGAGFQMVTPEYFDTFSMRIEQGRPFNDKDSEGTPKVAIVNQSFVARYLPGVDPLTQRIVVNQLIPGSIKPGPPLEWQIVGVVHSVRNQQGLRGDFSEIYVPFWQSPWPQTSIAIRTVGEPRSITSAVAAAVNAIDPDLPLAGVTTMDEIADKALAFDRFGVVLYGTFAVLALLLAAVGIYGVMAFAVSQRTHEFGVRVALGARAGQILGSVLLEGAVLSCIGLTIGLGGAYLVGRAMEANLYGVTATDLSGFVTISAVLLSAALLACAVPARRASRVDPMVALRYE